MKTIIDKKIENPKGSMTELDYIPEKYLTHDALSVNYLIKMLSKNKKCIVKIYINNSTGTGFLCKIPFPNYNNLLPVLITCNHVINENNIIEGKEIKMTFEEDKIFKSIIMDGKRKFYSNKDFDTTIIEIIEKDKFDETQFLYYDDKRFLIKNLELKKNSYLFHYQHGTALKISFATIKQIEDNKNYRFIHYCNTDIGSSGGPIFNSKTDKVFGIHLGSKNNCYNHGTDLEGPVNEFQKKYKIEESKIQMINNGNEINKSNVIENGINKK